MGYKFVHNIYSIRGPYICS